MAEASFEKFQELISALEKNKLKYVVIGGFAMDGKMRKLTREHNDIDVMCLKKDEAVVEKLLKSLHYSLTEQFNNLFKLKTVDGTKLDLYLVDLEGKSAVSKGRLFTIAFPKEMMQHDLQKGVINGFLFTIPGDSFLKKMGFGSKSDEEAALVHKLAADEKKLGLIRKIPRVV